jgi:hypothetical protein
MKSILSSILLISFLPFASFANEVVLTCKLRAIEDLEEQGMTISGTFTIEKLAKGKLVMKVDALMGEPEEEPQAVQAEDNVAAYERKDETSIPTAEAYVTSDGNLNAIREYLLAGEKISTYEFYNGENFQDDGAGLNLFSLKTISGKALTMVNIGWSFVYCE